MTDNARDCPLCRLPMLFHTHPGSCELPVMVFSESEWSNVERDVTPILDAWLDQPTISCTVH